MQLYHHFVLALLVFPMILTLYPNFLVRPAPLVRLNLCPHFLLVHFLYFHSLFHLYFQFLGCFPALRLTDLSSLNVPMNLTLTDLHKVFYKFKDTRMYMNRDLTRLCTMSKNDQIMASIMLPSQTLLATFKARPCLSLL